MDGYCMLKSMVIWWMCVVVGFVVLIWIGVVCGAVGFYFTETYNLK